MKSESCVGCLWEGECENFSAPCDYYTPVDDDEAQAKVVNHRGKVLYRRYWYEYCQREEE